MGLNPREMGLELAWSSSYEGSTVLILQLQFFCIIFTGLSLRSVRSRFAFLKALNSDVERLLLPVTDFRAADSYSLSTATLLREARGLLFYHTKVALLNHVLNHTAHRRAEDSPPEISLDPLEALEGNSIVV